MKLRPYQTDSIESLRSGFRAKHVRQVLAAPTGSGKSVVMVAMIDSAIAKGSRVLFICERRILVEQFSQHLDAIGIDHGVLMAAHWRWRPQAMVQVASVQTLERMEVWPDFDIVFIDELHACMRKSIIKMIKAFPDTRIVGATATPFHAGIAEHFSSVANVITMRELVDDGHLVPFRVFIAHEIETDGLKKDSFGEWNKKELESSALKVVGDVVSDYVKISHDVFGRNSKAICFSAGIAHGAELVQRFAEVGVNAVQLTCEDDDEYSADVLKDFNRHDTSIDMLISADKLTRGYDETSIELVILARPLRKSFSSFVQMVGRGARPHTGKEFCVIQDNCVAAGSKVLTHRGLVPIELILLSDKIWDGHDFVQHKGAICRGKKPVITYAGLTATRDHRVKTAEAWRTFGECSAEQTPIVTTGIGGTKIFERSNYFTAGRFAWKKRAQISPCFGGMRNVWESFNNFIFQSLQRGIQRLQTMQPNRQENATIPKLAFCAGNIHESAMREQDACQLRKLRRARNSIRVFITKSRGDLDIRELGNSGGFQKYGIGQNRQQWKLFSRKPSMGDSREKYGKSPKLSHDTKHAQVYVREPAGKIRSLYTKIIAFCGDVIRGNRGEVSQAQQKTEREVWDIIDCGSRNSFTCEGLLVHNCGNWMRFKESWDDLYSNGITELSSQYDAKARKEPTEREKKASKCPRCMALWPGNSDTCTHCGYRREKKSLSLTVPGEMLELTGDVIKTEKYSSEYKESFYHMLLGYCAAKGYRDGWAFHHYQEKFKVQPAWKKQVAAPDADVMGWIRHQNIKYAKRRAA